MHENLKYSINLDPNITPLTDESLLHSEGPMEDHLKRQVADWQPIYSGTCYGTRFFIYAKFIGNKVNTDFELNTIQFYLQNYEGGVSIGLNGFFDLRTPAPSANDPDLMDPKYPSRKKIVIDIGLQGFNNNYLERNFKPNPISIKEGDIIKCNCIFIPVESSISNIYDEQNLHESQFVDELFMERNGDEIFITSEGEKKLRELESKYQLVDAGDLMNAGIDISIPQNYISRVETKGRLFPCQPETSICYVS